MIGKRVEQGIFTVSYCHWFYQTMYSLKKDPCRQERTQCLWYSQCLACFSHTKPSLSFEFSLDFESYHRFSFILSSKFVVVGQSSPRLTSPDQPRPIGAHLLNGQKVKDSICFVANRQVDEMKLWLFFRVIFILAVSGSLSGIALSIVSPRGHLCGRVCRTGLSAGRRLTGKITFPNC